MLAHAWNPSTWEVEARGYPKPYSEYWSQKEDIWDRDKYCEKSYHLIKYVEKLSYKGFK